MHQTFVSLLVVCAVQRAEVRATQHVIRLCSFKQSRECFYIIRVKSRAVDRSTIQFLTILGVLLTKTCYYQRRALARDFMVCNNKYLKTHLLVVFHDFSQRLFILKVFKQS